jgi:hypothetical protein
LSRYTEAVAALVDPAPETVTRDLAPTRARVAELAKQHIAHVRYLRRRLRLAGAKGDEVEAERAVCAMTQAGERYRATKGALTAVRSSAPSLLEQLVDAVHSTNGAGNGSRGAHRSPLNSAAVELLAVLRRAIPVHHGPLRLDDAQLRHDLRCWRPADEVAAVEQLHGWAAAIREITEPRRLVELNGPCPACGERWIWAREAGERVRRSAVHVVECDPVIESYAECGNQACGARTPFARLQLLNAAMTSADKAG